MKSVAAMAGEVRTLIHAAGAGVVLTDLDALPRMLDVSLDGLLTSVRVFQPRRVIYASTCAVYGRTPERGADPDWPSVHPLSVYAFSKAMTEKALEQWARQEGSEGVVLRIGNAVGPGCKGLIPYLVRHAVQWPEGDVPARMRGGGKIFRDYVPIERLVEVVRGAMGADLPAGSTAIFNVGAGRVMSNGEVAKVVVEWLSTQGYKLRIEYSPEPDPSEAPYCRLVTETTERTFGIDPLTQDDINEAIVGGAKMHLETITSAGSKVAARPSAAKTVDPFVRLA
jgi:nucleoside-diphosphate-sugar epimerase